MKVQVLALVMGIGLGSICWLIWDYIKHLRRQITYWRARTEEIQARHDELVLTLDDRAEAARIDEAIRKGRFTK